MPYDIQGAIDYVLHWEDELLAGKVTTDAGGKTRFGISQRANPDLTDQNFYALPTAKALAVARDVYTKRYASHVEADQIKADAVRCKILDMYVNIGGHAVKIVQRAVGVPEDGAFGPNTLRGVNSVTPDSLTLRLANMSCGYYDNLVASDNEHISWRRRGTCMGQIGVNSPFFPEVKTWQTTKN